MSKQKGFTLIEAAVAIAVVAILSGIIVPLVVKNVKDSQVARARNDVQVIAGIIGTQYKDTGSRPIAGGIGASTGGADQGWFSGSGILAAAAPTIAGSTIAFPLQNTFTNLFTTTAVAGTALQQTMFGLPATTAITAEFAYKGPYMSPADALKTDPWGTPYIILGYNLTQQAANGPIWVASLGPDRATVNTNVAAVPPATWTTTAGGTGADDIVARVN